MAITVRPMEKRDIPTWDAYVRKHQEGTFCHLAGWSNVIQSGARQKSTFLIAEHEGRIVGVLPLVHRQSFLFGDALISTMFAVYGGPLADNESGYEALEEAAWELTCMLGVPSLEYRTVHALCGTKGSWVVDKGASTFRKKLKNAPEDILLDIPRKQRAVVRKSLKLGLTCRWEKDIDTFYALYAESVRNLGTPVFPKQLFSEFVSEFGDSVEIQVIYAPDGTAIASLMSFYHKNWVLPYYAGGSSLARKYSAHDFMYYKLMVHAAERGATSFDFGRSKNGTGPYKFKKNWGFDPTPLEYQSRLIEGASKADLNPANKKFELMVKIWKKLPLPIANFIGPSIARHLG